MNNDDETANRPAAPGSDELLRLIVESAADFAIISMDPLRRVTSWNPGAERVLGYREEEILGRIADVIFTPEDRADGIPERERSQALVQGRAEDERWTLRKDGSRFWASGLMMPLADPSLGFVKIFRDRTDGHRAEARLRESEERFRLLANSIPQLVFRTRNDGWRTWGSPQWIDFTGLSLEESMGLGWLAALHPDDVATTRQAWAQARQSGEYYVEHRVRCRADGEYRWHQTRARPLETSIDGDWIGTMTDVHELRALQDRQQVLMAELQHRTRNLLAIVQAIVAQTRRRSDSLESFGTELESRLRALSRVQSLLSRLGDQQLDVGDLIRAEVTARNTVGETRIEGPPMALAAASAQTLGLALHELATNAVKYGALAQPGARLEVRWREELNDGRPLLVLDWSEHGVTMPHEARLRRKGYGTELIERALPYQLGATTKLEFGADGVRCTIVMPLPDAGGSEP